GMAVGIALTLLQQQFGLIEIPADSFLVKSYPVALEWGDLLLIAATFIPVGWVLVQLTVGNMIKDEEL
ncbi:MAG: ABC transporter permease, partial [Alistipes sp.]|nr:ABC transporter permease [Alistipes sp.]